MQNHLRIFISCILFVPQICHSPDIGYCTAPCRDFSDARQIEVKRQIKGKKGLLGNEIRDNVASDSEADKFFGLLFVSKHCRTGS